MDLPPVEVLALGVVVALHAVLLLRVVTRLSAREPAVTAALVGDDGAARLRSVGEVFAVLVVASSAVRNAAEGDDLLRDLGWSLALATVGVLLVLVVGRLGLGLLFRARLPELLARGNKAAGFAAGAHYAATGLLTSHAVAGSDARGLGLSFAFFLLAQLTLHGVVSLFRALTTYDDAEQIEGENFAAALSYGGVAVAVAVIVARALEGAFTTWADSLRGYAMVLASVLLLYPVRQLFVQALLLGGGVSLRRGRIDEAISKRNEGVAAVEAASYLAAALAIVKLA